MEYITNPTEIEKRSFEIISRGLSGKAADGECLNVIKRVIHTTADFDYEENLVFSHDAISAGKNALRNGADIVTDTRMAQAGINKKAASRLGCAIHCFIDDEEAARTAKAGGFTRARAAVDTAVQRLGGKPVVFAVGNAPTALIRLHELISAGELLPALVIAVPVGFVNVTESKELIMGLPIPHIAAKGRKGGSNVAAAILNALLYDVTERQQP